MNCRHCGVRLTHTFLDLGFAPPSNAYLNERDLTLPESYYPLRLNVCTECWLVQTEDYSRPDELFLPDYAYFSSTSSTWVVHARDFCEQITRRLGLGKQSYVVEIACNDGYLLKNFVEAGIPCLGIEPTESTARASEEAGIAVIREFFGAALAEQLVEDGKEADLIVGNNVYGHVPDINDFTIGLKRLLKRNGTITLEFPHLLNLVNQIQFDTVYHEHFSYLSLSAVNRIFGRAGLRIVDVELLPTHGGSLRVYGCHDSDDRPCQSSVMDLLHQEKRFGLEDLTTYREFQSRVDRIKDDTVMFLIEQKRSGKRVAGYGGAAKGNTLLNYAGIKPDLLPYVCDAAPSKQLKYLPGSHIPILPPKVLDERRPDLVWILPWNIAEEIVSAQARVRDWEGNFFVTMPSIRII